MQGERHTLHDLVIYEYIQCVKSPSQWLLRDGYVHGITPWSQASPIAPSPGQEGRTPVDLLMGVTATDVLEVFSDAEIQHGFEADHRDRLLRTFVTNNYRYHLQVSAYLISFIILRTLLLPEHLNYVQGDADRLRIFLLLHISTQDEWTFFCKKGWSGITSGA